MTDLEARSTLYSETQVRHLVQVLEDFRRGELLIPKFQRPLVWSKEMRLALLDSVLKGMPIGAIIAWKSRSADVVVQDRLEPFVLPEPEKNKSTRTYILDGLQRLSTLYFALFEPEAPIDSDGDASGRRDNFRVYYDLRGQRFLTRRDLKNVYLYHLPLAALLSGPRLTRFQRNLYKSTHGDTEVLIERSDEVADAFRQYKLPIVSIVSEDIDLVTLAFERINSQRAPMGEVHMVNTLAWGPNFDLVARLRAIKQGVLAEHGWDEIDDITILRASKVALGMPAYEMNTGALSEHFKQDPGSLDKAIEHLVRAIEFLGRNGIRAPYVVPYAEQVLLLVGAFREDPNPSKEAQIKLYSWLWLTTYGETFRRPVSESRFSQLLAEVCGLARGDQVSPLGGEWPSRRPLSVFFDFGRARGKGLALLLALKRQEYLTSKASVNPFNILAGHGAKAVPQLVSSFMADAAVAASPGARVLLRPEAVGRLRKALKASTNLSDEYLKSHVISSNTHQAFRDGDYEAFVTSRTEDLDELEEARFVRILGRLY